MRKKHFGKRPILLTGFILIFMSNLFSQVAPSYIDISKINVSKVIKDSMQVYITNLDTDLKDSLPFFQFKKGTSVKGAIPPTIVSKKPVIKFYLVNPTDSILKVYFTPGFYFRDYKLYELHDNDISVIEKVFPGVKDKSSYSLLQLNPKDTLSIVAELYFEKTYTNILKPVIINESQLSTYTKNIKHIREELNIVTYTFCGLLLMMIFFSLTSYFSNSAPEFLYYSGYAFFLGFMLFTKTLFIGESTWIARFMESYMDFIFQSLGVMFYMLFMQQFLETKKHFNFLFHLYNAGIIVLIAAVGTYSFFHFFTNDFKTELFIETITKVLLLGMAVIFIIYGFRNWKYTILRYLVYGNLLLFIFSMISQLNISFKIINTDLPTLFSSSLFYYELGLFLELVLFLAALNYKNRLNIIAQTKERLRLKSENQLKEVEKELAVYKAQQEERNRISLDMHDELGSGMTAIRLMSEIARKKMDGKIPVEIDRISNSANELLNKMNAIIWSMNSRNDTVDNLIAYIREYVIEYFENTNIIGTVDAKSCNENKEILGDKRRNIFLCVKETITNIVKHSHATVAEINIICNEDKLVIHFHDNGVGIDLDNIRQFSNGLQSLKSRMEKIGGSFHIEKNNGTVTILELPVT
jgi:signal transduction histidine kinase